MTLPGKHRSAGWIAVLLSFAILAAADRDLRLLEAVKDRAKGREEVRALLEKHVDVNAAQPDGATALAWTAHWDDLETADLLIAAGASVNAANQYGVTPLSLACTNASASMVDKLLKAGKISASNAQSLKNALNAVKAAL